MASKAVVRAIRNLLTRTLAWIEKSERTPARAHKRHWYQIEFHVPPSVVAFLCSFALFVTFLWGEDTSWIQAAGLAVFIIISVVLFTVYLARDHKDLAHSDDAMSLLGVIFFVSVILMKVVAVLSPRYPWLSPYLTPVAIAPLLTALLLHPRLAMVVSFAVAIFFGIINDFSFPIALVGVVGGFTAVAVGTRARTAHHVARAGFMAGIVQMLVVVFLAISMGWTRAQTTLAVTSAFLSGVFSAFFTLGALPFLESFFSRTSNLRLLELSDVNHPLLKQMSIEAPGTYHHSLIMASLAEDAANAIGANGLLCRVGAYFHDIGKLVKTEYFIENQGTLGNPHDQVSPSLSRIIIISHVKEGLALARENKLDKQVTDFIPQHHGTSQIEYFYRKALQLEGEQDRDDSEGVSEQTYRYPGPKPQSKETAIVMLADSVEAASRTLEEPNHQRYKDLVYKIINKKLFDGQLEETPLTLRDLHAIGERFTATLISIHHSRIPYPEPENSKKEKREELPHS